MCYISVYFHVFCFAFIYHQSSAYCSFLNLCYYYFNRSHQCPTINMSSAYAIYCLVLLKTVAFRLVFIFLIMFSSTIFNSHVESASPCLKTLSNMLQSIVLGFSLFHLNSASFLLSSLIFLRS
jgi:hypothetical protein